MQSRHIYSLMVTNSLSLALMLLSCAPPSPPKSYEWRDTRKTLHITVKSIPSGADLYGMSGNSLGDYIGKTPHTFRFWVEEKYGKWALQCQNCGSELDQVLDVVAEEKTWSTKRYVAFKSAVVKEGYKPYVVYEVLQDNSEGALGRASFDNLTGNKSFTAFLEQTESVSQTRTQPQHQQQQQQQQTVIVPNSEKEFGKLLISCNVENAEISVDGVFVGNVPATLKLKDGIHIIEVKKSDYVAYKKEVRVLAESELSLRVELIRLNKKDNKDNDG